MLSTAALEKIKTTLYLDGHRRAQRALDHAVRILNIEHDTHPVTIDGWLDAALAENQADDFENPRVTATFWFAPDCGHELTLMLADCTRTMLGHLLTELRPQLTHLLPAPRPNHGRAAVERDGEGDGFDPEDYPDPQQASADYAVAHGLKPEPTFEEWSGAGRRRRKPIPAAVGAGTGEPGR